MIVEVELYPRAARLEAGGGGARLARLAQLARLVQRGALGGAAAQRGDGRVGRPRARPQRVRPVQRRPHQSIGRDAHYAVPRERRVRDGSSRYLVAVADGSRRGVAVIHQF